MQTGDHARDPRPGEDDEAAAPEHGTDRATRKPIARFTPRDTGEPDDPTRDEPYPKVGPPPM
jgi:hypothetical protein